MNENSQQEKIKCLECNKTFKQLSNSHLKSHNLTPEEYKLKHNVEKLSSQKSIDNMKKRARESNKHRKGIKRSKEICENIKNSIRKTFDEGRIIHNKGIPMKEDQKLILKEKALERNKIWRENNNNPLTGHDVSDETKEKISNSLKRFNIETYDNKDFSILHNKDKLYNELKTKSPKILSQENNVSEASIYIYIKKYEIEYKYRSSYEIELEQFLRDENICYEYNTRNVISPYELDFYLPDYNIGIEINGLYWHSNIFKENNYHLKKYNLCKEKNIRLIMIQSDEWVERKELIKSKIRNLIGKSNKGLPARKLYISKIENNIANNFCDKFHIQGKTGQIKYACGAYDNDKLVGVMIFNQQRNTQDIELIRFCTDGDIHNGLFSKMLKFSIKENNYTKIISFADLRYSEGNLYEKTGFVKNKIICPDYMYIINGKRVHKSNYSKNSIKKKKLFSEEYINLHTETQLTEELDIPKIYDIGKIKYEIEN